MEPCRFGAIIPNFAIIASMIESHRVECKAKLTDDLEKEAVAFLNAREGGVIYVGVDAAGTPIPNRSIDTLQLKIKDRIKHNIAPSVLGLYDVVIESIEGVDVVKIIVASGSEKPYYLKKRGMSEKGCFLRIGSASEPMDTKMIEELSSRRIRNSIGKIVSNRQDLTFAQLKIYYKARGLQLNENFARNLELLTEEGAYNYVAYLMADQNNISIKVAKYAGTDRVTLIESNEYGYQSLIKATKAVLDKLDLENVTMTQITHRERIEQRIWDAVALREAVINAIVHNDYTNEIPPKFEIFEDRLEITSAGGLPEGMDTDEFFEGVSNPRNKEIMRIFKDLEMVEQLGSGVPRILRSYTKENFVFMNHFTRMILPKKIGGQIGDSIHLTDRQHDILNLIRQDKKISRKALSHRLDVSESAIQKHLETLKEKGVVKRVGGTRGWWEVMV